MGITFYSNLAAVHFEKGDFDACIQSCDEAVAVGKDFKADAKMLAKALTRKGNALVKQGQLEKAVAAFKESLAQQQTEDAAKALEAAEKELSQAAESADAA